MHYAQKAISNTHKPTQKQLKMILLKLSYVMLKSLCFYNSKEKVLMLINVMISKIFLTFTRNVSENKAFFDVSNPFIYKIEGLFYEQILMQKSCYYAENSCHEQKVLAILLY